MTTPFDEFRRYLEQRDRSTLTVAGYLKDLEHFAACFERQNGEPFSPQAVTPSDVRRYREHLLHDGQHKASTVNRRLAALSAYMKWALHAGRIESDPTREVRSVRQTSPGPKYLDRKQQYALQRAIEKDVQIARLRYPKRWVARLRDASLVTALLHTGLRIREMLDIRLGDVQLGDRKGQLTVRQGKGGRQRMVPLNSDARKALSDWLAVRPPCAEDYIWVAVEGEADGALSSRSVQRVLLRIGQDAGLERLTPHVLRHTFAKNLVDNGVGLEKVAALLGHSSLNTTRIYIAPNQNDLEKAVERLAGDH